jgi:hypothetical protein
MKIKLIIILFLLIGGFFASLNFSFGSIAFAEESGVSYGETTTPKNPIGLAGGLVPCGNNVDGTNDACTLCHFVIGFQNLVNFMLKLVVTVGFVGIFASGVLYIISAGDEKMIGSAKSALTASLVGFAIVLGAWLIVNVTLWVFSANLDMQTGGNWYTLVC